MVCGSQQECQAPAGYSNCLHLLLSVHHATQAGGPSGQAAPHIVLEPMLPGTLTGHLPVTKEKTKLSMKTIEAWV